MGSNRRGGATLPGPANQDTPMHRSGPAPVSQTRGMELGRRQVAVGCVALAGLAGGALLVVRGALTIDLGVGRRTRGLGPLNAEIMAEPEAVFDVVAAPYLGRTPRAMTDKLRVVERGTDMVIAEHYTPVLGGRSVSITVESVRFERPRLIHFRLLRGPVPLVTETFEFKPGKSAATTDFEYRGELSTDLWSVGAWWGRVVARRWEAAVSESLQSIRAEAERRARAG
jgi:Polyketide cyclase / dehydrase and lipid transport